MTIEQALISIRPGAQWELRGQSYADLIWRDQDQQKPTWLEIANEMEKSDQEPVLEEVSLRQFLMASDRSGLLASLESLKTNEAIPIQTRRDIHFFLEYSNFIERNHPLIAQLAPVLGVTNSQIDAVFTMAATL